MAWQAEAGVNAVAEREWRSTLLPIIENSCLDCHTGEHADGSLDLSAFETVERVVEQRRLWTRIATRVRDRQMPPEDGPELSDEDRTKFLKWIDETLPELACSHDHHAGPVTIRRLTRYEYANTVRELFDVDYAFTDAFPADEVGYGFDNIGDVLSVSPLLLEKYLTAGEAISELVIRDPLKSRVAKTIDASEFASVPGGHLRGSHYLLTTTGTITSHVDLAVEGRYKIEVVAFGNQAGKELPELAISCNGKVIRNFSVRPENPEEAETFEVLGKLNEGSNKIQVTFTNDFYNPRARNRRRRDRNLAVGNIRVSGPQSLPGPSAAQQQFLFVSPDPVGDEKELDRESAVAAATKVIDLHASRAFRRKVYSSERKKLIELFQLGLDNGESFEGAMQLVVQSLLVSPHFLYKVELPCPRDGSARPMSDYELATALSYFLWSSMPDDRLFRLATRGELSDRSVLVSETRRLLSHENAVALVDNFAAQWLQLRILEQVDPDPDKFPGFTEHLRDSMVRETALLLSDVIQKDAPLTTLLTANYTYVNKALARHYGWSTDGLGATDFQRVDLQGKNRRGLLSHASFLTLTSNPTRTSPVKRGKWILENLLADPPPPALADVPQLDSQEELKGTLRQRMEQHRADPNCATCHYKMDSLGFALENFDGFGKFRDSDEGQVIDSAGELPGGLQFDSAAGLQSVIATHYRRQFVRCIVEKLYIYALGRGPTSTDECLIEAIAREAFEKDLRFSDIVLAIVTSEAFLNRSRPPEPVSQQAIESK